MVSDIRIERQIYVFSNLLFAVRIPDLEVWKPNLGEEALDSVKRDGSQQREWTPRLIPDCHKIESFF